MVPEPGDAWHLGAAADLITVTEVPRRAGAVLIEVAGDLDMVTAHVFLRRMSEILGDRTDRPVELDLSALAFCDLTGMRALESLGDGGVVRIVRAGGSLDLLLRLCRTAELLGYTPPVRG